MPTYSPFDILGVASTAQHREIVAAYRSLVRKYHPDTNPRLDLVRANQAMARLNWAVEELTRGLDMWRLKAPRLRPWPSVLPTVYSGRIKWTIDSAVAIRQVEIVPSSIVLNDKDQAVLLIARADRLDSSSIHVRFRQPLFVSRLRSRDDRAVFQVSAPLLATHEFRIEPLDVLAPSFPPQRVLVSVSSQAEWAEERTSGDWFSQRLQSVDRLVKAS